MSAYNKFIQFVTSRLPLTLALLLAGLTALPSWAANSAAGVTVSERVVKVGKSAATATYTVVLDSQPTGPVTITPSSSAPGFARISPATLHFDVSNWNIPQPVTVTSVTNDITGPARTSTITHAVAGYGDVTSASEVTVYDTEGPVVTLEILHPFGPSGREGTTVYFGARLSYPNDEPLDLKYEITKGVGFLRDGDPSMRMVRVSPGTMRTPAIFFGTENDERDEPDGELIVTLLDGNGYQVGTPSMTAPRTILDDDTAGVTVSRRAVSVAENGGQRTYTLALESEPTGPVTITPSSGDAGVAGVSSALTFTASDWSTPQTVTVTGVDDDFDNPANTRRTTITHMVAGGGYGYDNLSVEPVAVTVTDDDTTGVTVSKSVVRVGTSAPMDTYAIRLDSKPTGDVIITPRSSTPGFATVAPASLLFTQDDWSVPQTVTVFNSDVISNPADRRATIIHRVSGYDGIASAPPVTVYDAAGPIITFESISTTGPNQDHMEGSSVYFWAHLSYPSAERLDLKYEITEGSHFLPGDPPETLRMFSVRRGQTRMSESVRTEDDDQEEPDGFFTVTLREGSGYQVGTPNTARRLIRDREDMGLLFSRIELSIPEAGMKTYTVKPESNPDKTITIKPSVDDKNVAEVSPLMLTFTTSNWRTAQPVTVTGVDDDRFLANRVATITHQVFHGSDPNPDPNAPAYPVKVTVRDNDATVLSVADAAAREGNRITFTAELTEAIDEPVTAYWTTSDGTAIGLAGGIGADYTSVFDGQVTIPANALSAAFTVMTTEDRESEGADETFTVTLSERNGSFPDGVTLGRATATGTIRDDDSATLSVNNAAADEGDPVTFTVSLSSPAASAVKVDWATADDTATGSANGADADYTSGSGQVTLAPGRTTAEFTVVTTEDVVSEDEETFTVTLSEPDGSDGFPAGVSLDDAEATGTIRNDDVTGVMVSENALTVDEDAGTNTYTVVLTSQPTATVTVTPTSTHTSVATVSPSPLTFDASNWNTPQTVMVTGVGDTYDNPAGRATTITHAVSGYGDIRTANPVTITSADNEATPTVTLVLTPPSILENGGRTTVTASLDHGSTEEVKLTVSASPAPPAVAGDFRQTGTMLTIPARQAKSISTGVTIEAVNNAVGAPDKTVTVSAVVSGNSGVPNPASRTLTIVDDEAGVIIRPTELTVTEASGDDHTATYTVVLDTKPTESVTVAPRSDDPTAATVTGPLTFTPENWNVAQVVVVTAVDDDMNQPTDRTATITHDVSGGGYDRVTAMDVTVTVTDNDDASITIAPTVVTVAEAGGKATYRVVLSSVPTGEVIITPSSDTPTAATVTGPLTFTMDNWSDAQTVTVTGVDDRIDNPGDQRSATISHMVAGGGYNDVPAADVTVTVTDDEGAPTVTLAMTDAAIAENGGTTTVTAELSHASSHETVVTVTPVSDLYTVAAETTITIPADATTSTDTVTIAAVNDDIDNVPDKSGTVTATAENTQGVGTVTGASLTLTDDEATPIATLVLTPRTINESGGTTTSTVTAELNHGSSELVTLTVSAAPGAGAEAGDFTLSQTRELTIAAEATTSTGEVTITANDDNEVAPNRMVTVSAAVSGNSGIPDPTDATLTITEDEMAMLSVADAGADEGQPVTFTVTLSKPAASDVKVDWATSDGTAMGSADGTGTDYTTASDQVTITAGDSEATFTVATTDDQIAEGNETFTVTLSAPAGGFPAGVSLATDATATGTVTDNDSASVTVGQRALTVTEAAGGRTANYTVALTSEPTGTVTITPSSGDAGVAEVSDALTFTMGNWNTAQMVTVTGVDDAIDNPTDRTTTVRHRVEGGGYGSIVAADVAVTVTDDDTAGVTVSKSSVTMSEADGKAIYTVMLDSQPAGPVTVTPESDDTTVATVSPSPLTFTPGNWNTAQAVTVTGVDDGRDNPTDRTTTITHRVSGYGDITTAPNVAVTATDDEGTPTATLELTSPSIGENGGSTTVTAKLSVASAADVTLTVAAMPDSPATSGDFTLTGSTLTIAAGQTTSTGTVTIRAEDNQVDAPDKTVTVSAKVMGGSGVSDPASQTLTITDDENAPTVTLTVTDAAIPENGGTTTVTAKLSHASSEETVVTVTPVSDLHTVGADATITIPAGATDNAADTATIAAVDDRIDNVSDRTVTVTGTARNTQGVGTVTGAALTLTDDESTPTATLKLTPARISEGGTSTVTATLDHGSSEAVTLTVSARAVSPAVPGDFTLSQATELTIAAGATDSTGTVTIEAANNNVVAPDKTVTVTATVGGNSGIPDPSDATLTITEDEMAMLSVADASVAEGRPITFTVSLNADASADVKVDWATSDGTATGSANGAGADYTSASGQATIPAGARTATFTVATTGDDVAEGDETFTVTLTEPGGSDGFPDGVSLGDAEATGTITDNDSAGITIDPAAVTVAEAGGEATYTVALGSAPTGNVTITPSSDTLTAARVSEALTFTPGNWNTVQTITVTGVDDDIDNPGDTRTATISHMVAGGGYDDVPATDVTVIVTDDDTAGVTVSKASVTMSEAGGEAIYTVMLDSQPAGPVTVTPESDDTTVATVSPSPLTFTLGNWNTAQTVTVTGVDDDRDNPTDRTTTITHRVSGYGDITTAPNVAVTATDDEGTPTATLELTSPSIGENGGGTTVTAKLSVASAADVTLTVSAMPDSPATSGDFTLTGSTLTIAAGQTTSTGTVTVRAEDNQVDAPDKTVTVSAKVMGGSGVSDPASQTLTITDDENAPTVTLTVTDATIPENGGTTTVTARLSHASSQPTTVTVTAVADLYTVGSDATITIAVGATANAADTATIAAVNDDIDNVPDKSGTVTATAVNTQGVGTVTGAALALTDDEATPTATLVLTPASIAENGGTSTVTAELNHGSSEAVTLTVSAEAGSGTTDNDFRLTGTTLTIAPEATGSSGTVMIAAENNNVVAPNKTVTVSAAVGGDSGIPDPSAATLTITEDDSATVSVAGAGAEEGQPITFRVSLSGEASADVAVDWATSDGTATGSANGVGADYTIGSGRVTITAGDTEATFNVATTDDQIAESAETFTVTLSAPAGGFPDGVSLGTATTTGTITDNDSAGITIDPAAVTVTEAGGTANYRVALGSAPTGNVTITPSSDTLTAARVSDALTFTPSNWNTAQAVTVTGVDDGIDNPDDQRTATISHAVSGGGYNNVPAANVAVTVTDDEDAPTVTLTVTDAAIAENGGTTMVTAELSHASSQETVFTVTPVSDLYTVGADATIAIPAGATDNAADTATITAVNDDIDNVPDKSGTVMATAVNTQGVGTVTDAALTLTDDEATPTATLVLTPASIAENGGASTVTATLNHGSSEAVTLMVSAEAGSGTADSDFRLTGTTLTIAPEATGSSGTVTVTAENNNVVAPNKTVTVSAAVGGDSGISPPSAATLIITEDDSATASVAGAGAEEGQPITFRVSLSAEASADVKVNWATSDGTANSADYTGGSGQVTISAGDTEATINVATTDDQIAESAETFTVTLTAPTGGFPDGVSLGTATATGTVTDNDSAGITINPTAVTVAEASGEATYTVALSSTPTGNVTITPSSDASTVARVSGALTFTLSNWSTTQTVTVTGVDDAIDNPGDTRSATINHLVSGGGYNNVPATDVTVTVTDDDTAGVDLGKTSVTVPEAGGTDAYTVALTSQPDGTVTVTPASEDTTVAMVSPSPLTFTPGNWNTAQTVTITGVDDAVNNNPDRTSTITHTVAGGNYNGVSAGSVAVTVTDDDGKPVATLVLTPPSIKENGGTTTVTATLSKASTADVMLSVSATPDDPATTSDFTLSQATTLTIAAGRTSSTGTVTITARDNQVETPDKTITVAATVSGASGVQNPDPVTLTVEDDDRHEHHSDHEVVVGKEAVTVAEPKGSSTYTLALTHAPIRPVTVTPNITNTSVATVSPALTFTPSNWRIPQTVTVTAVDDAVDNPGNARTTTISHKVTGYGYVTAAPLVAVRVSDDDDAGITISQAAVTIPEASDGAYTLVLESEPWANVTITPTSDDPNTATVSPPTLSFTPNDWNVPQTVTVAGVEDDIHQASDRMTAIKHKVVGGGYDKVAVADVVVTIVDDDVAPPAMVTGVTVTPGIERLSVTWLTATNADGYEVQWKSGSEGYDAASRQMVTESTSQTIAGLVPGIEYTVRVISTRINAANGMPSAEAKGTPSAPPLVISASADVATVTEGEMITFTLTSDRAAPAGGTAVAVTISGQGDFVAGADLGAHTMTIPRGAFTATRKVVTIADEVSEADGSVTLVGQPGPGYRIANPPANMAKVVIEDDDGMRPRRQRELESGLGAIASALGWELTETVRDRSKGVDDSETRTTLRGLSPLSYAGRFLVNEAQMMSAGLLDPLALNSAFDVPGSGGGAFNIPGIGAPGLGTPGSPGVASAPEALVAGNTSRLTLSNLLAQRPEFSLLLTPKETDDEAEAAHGDAGGPLIRVWAKGGLTDIEYSPFAGLSQDGSLTTGRLGLDASYDSGWVLGATVGWQDAQLDFEDSVGGVKGDMGIDLWSLAPYASYTRGRLRAWGTAGTGRGTLRREERWRGSSYSTSSDLEMWSTALGVEYDLGYIGALDLIGRGEAMLIDLGVPGVPHAQVGYDDIDVSSHGLRGEFELGWPLRYKTMEIRPYIRGGLRWDGGDVQRESGLEYGGGVSIQSAGLSMEGSMRRQSGGHQNRVQLDGYQVTLEYDRDGNQRGLMLSLRRSPGLSSFDPYGRGSLGLLSPGSAAGSLDMRISYGLVLGEGVLTPYMERDWRRGSVSTLRPGLAYQSKRLNLELDHTPTGGVTLRSDFRVCLAGFFRIAPCPVSATPCEASAPFDLSTSQP